MRYQNIYKSILFYVVGLALLYLSIFLSNILKYNGHFISALPIVLPLVFSAASIGVAVILIMEKDSPWFFRTGIMSLVIGITLFLFGILTFYLGVESLVWAGSVVIGILFIIAAMVRLIIQGGLSTYRKIRK
ncbi:TVG0149603 [Thermoplasma volcanium GSS1]|uniref:TVG0149603 protein n=1 Tax=Thermoplasma volcanium (strain ATCC 51530 / DSM 4299 / JCM 9571 / NBRC 15438 / GSS1) TaxID=273116 RepID=Q97CF7_THEVO|nr:hypothetical protein [Thermoplasma volcanium]BAB59286.1 TVG0149603 [Thermoplasma volcanium GSS1]